MLPSVAHLPRMIASCFVSFYLFGAFSITLLYCRSSSGNIKLMKIRCCLFYVVLFCLEDLKKIYNCNRVESSCNILLYFYKCVFFKELVFIEPFDIGLHYA